MPEPLWKKQLRKEQRKWKQCCFEAGNWEYAETAGKQLLALAGDDATHLSAEHQELGALYSFLGRHEEALQEAQAAVAVARTRAGLRGWKFWLCNALERQARYALRLGDAAQALEAISEARNCLPDETLGENFLHPPTWATLLVMRARCLLETCDEAGAEAALAEAWDVLEANPRRSPGGKSTAIMPWWETTARLRAARGDLHGAVEAWREVVALRRARSSTFLLSDVLYGLGQALLAVGDDAAGEAALQESRALRPAGLPWPV